MICHVGAKTQRVIKLRKCKTFVLLWQRRGELFYQVDSKKIKPLCIRGKNVKTLFFIQTSRKQNLSALVPSWQKEKNKLVVNQT